MIEYFKPIPIIGQLSTTVWGASTVGARDPSNGLEDPNNYYYWDGKILKASDGKYHLFCSQWPKSAGFGGWGASHPAHATASNILGPYKSQGEVYTYGGGQGHNTTAIALPDGTFAVVVGEIVPGYAFTSSSLDGTFAYKGTISTDPNGHNTSGLTSNLTVTLGPDNRIWATSRHGFIMWSDNIVGKYVVQTDSVYPQIAGMNFNNAEDPVIWYSGGYYHVVYNYWDARKGYHIMSADGVRNWINTGIALDRTTDFLRYTDGTVNHWGNIERPGVYMEDGHVTHFSFAVTEVNKDANPKPASSKIIVVPFDGVAFDADNAGGGGAGGSGGPADAGRGGAPGAGGTGAVDAAAGGRSGLDAGSAPGGAGGGAGAAGTSGGSSTGSAGGGVVSSGGTTATATGGGGGAGNNGGSHSGGTGGASVAGGAVASGGSNASGGRAAGGTSGNRAGGTAGGTTSSSGCTCHVAGAPSGRALGVAMAILALVVVARRRHRREREPR